MRRRTRGERETKSEKKKKERERERERERADDTVQNPYKCEKKTRSVGLHGGERLNGQQVYHSQARPQL